MPAKTTEISQAQARAAHERAQRTAAQTTTAPSPDDVSHEEFCLPRPDADEPRMEAYLTHTIDPRTGLAQESVRVVRCIECGAQRQTRIEDGNA